MSNLRDKQGRIGDLHFCKVLLLALVANIYSILLEVEYLHIEENFFSVWIIILSLC
jgi:hypothetical protein